MTSITFKNGKTIEVEQNGSTFITETKPTFPSDLSDIEITDGETTTNIENGMIVECYGPNSEYYYFSIIEKPYNIILEERLNEQEDIICDLLMNLL